MDGLLGVAGMMKLIASQWIIPENSLCLAQVSQSHCHLEDLRVKPSGEIRPMFVDQIEPTTWHWRSFFATANYFHLHPLSLLYEL